MSLDSMQEANLLSRSLMLAPRLLRSPNLGRRREHIYSGCELRLWQLSAAFHIRDLIQNIGTYSVISVIEIIALIMEFKKQGK